MKKERSRQLSQNLLSQWLEKTINNLKPYATTISRMIFVLLMILILFLIWKNFSASNKAGLGHDVAELRNLTFGASPTEELEKMIDGYLVKYPSGEGNAQISLVAGDIYYAHAIENLNIGKREDVAKQLEKSQNFYKSAVEKSQNNPRLTEQATWGLGQVSESFAAIREGQDLDDAIAQYETICKKYPDGVYVKLAEKQLNFLKKDVNKIFLSEYQKSDIALFKPEFEVPNTGTSPDATKELDPTMPMPGSFNPGLLDDLENSATENNTSENSDLENNVTEPQAPPTVTPPTVTPPAETQSEEVKPAEPEPVESAK
ncbi:MAG: hypothetical protein LBJ67_16975 [Planctomycetaceae bacterium]|jgi:hypothetical protein|nr:hypothetical protein [Planctomycetaceae bacterium]